ncbi:paraquat-inducible protein B [uncultured Gammaproteobacteria bacterium]
MNQPGARAIGLFVLGALILILGGAIVFSRASVFQERPRAVSVFHGSVTGLGVGAPVTFRGVRVGTVIDILLRINAESGDASIPVIMEFDPARISLTGAKGEINGDTVNGEALSRRMVERGLRAALVMQSLITGQLQIELDYHPDSDPALSGLDLRLLEIPEVRSGINAIKDTISRLPFQDLADTGLAALRDIHGLLSSPDTQSIVQSAAATMLSVAEIAEVTRHLAPAMIVELHQTISALKHAAKRGEALLGDAQPQIMTALGHSNHLLTTLDQRSVETAVGLQATLAATNRALAQGEAMLAALQTLTAPRAALVRDLETLLRNLAASSGSLRAFAEQIERNPNALVMGRSGR